MSQSISFMLERANAISYEICLHPFYTEANNTYSIAGTYKSLQRVCDQWNFGEVDQLTSIQIDSERVNEGSRAKFDQLFLRVHQGIQRGTARAMFANKKLVVLTDHGFSQPRGLDE